QVSKLSALLGLLVLAWSISLLLGLLPLQPLDANAFSAYWSHFNSLRLAKGLAWGLVVFGLFRSQTDQKKAFETLSIGMALGVLGVSLWALWEEALFAGSATTADYRVTASFSSMHTGGGHIEAYLVMALPFVWGLLFLLRNPFYRALLGASFLLGAYALFFTVARGGAIALVLALMILIWGTWVARRNRVTHRARSAVPLVMGLLTLMVMVAGVSGVFWRERLQQTGTDAGIRFHHWAEVLDMRNAGLITSLFGQGLGSFPAVSLANQLPDQAGSYRYVYEPDGNTYLALNSAGTLYMAQRIEPRPAQALTLELSVRAPTAKAGLEASLCEKSLFNSRRCQWLKVDFKAGAPEWQNRKLTFNSGEVGAGNFLTRRPVQFSLYNPNPGTVVEVDNVRLMDESGHDILRNGDFSRGGDFWFFKAGNHLFWHAKNLWVHLLFEQGWLGMSLFTLILILALVRLTRAAARGELEATVLLASIAAWIIVGGVDSLLDAPRIALLVYGTLFIGAAWGAAPRAQTKYRKHRHRHRPPEDHDHVVSPA
ncbi:MAG TPA: O-antigen ligase family protein, partial [Thiobacillaceae bacterium]|nr:O-antigen ligase family protein [Thiobacillaceae bacterium]